MKLPFRPARLLKLRTLVLGSQASMAIFLVSCVGNSEVIEVEMVDGFQPNYGPFDSNGNYVERWADKPPKRRYISREDKNKRAAQLTVQPAPQLAPQPIVQPTPPARTSTASRSSTSNRSSSASRPSAQKVTPRVKPPILHTVRKGDTLYAISRKYGSSVGAIQRANNLSGTNIRIGQRLTVPRK